MNLRFWRIAPVFWLLTAGAALAVEAAPQIPPAAAPSPSAWPPPPPVVAFEKLMTFLPEPPSGWTAEKPGGSTTDIEVFRLSSASRTYVKDGGDDDTPVVTVTILDAGGHQGYFDLTTKAWHTESRTPEGYDKPVQIDGMPGFEHSSVPDKSSSLWVVAGKRYFVQIEVTNQDPKELREWLNRIDLKKLAELK